MAWKLFKRQAQQSKHASVDYSSHYDSDSLIPHVKSSEGAIAGLKKIFENDELTEVQKTNITDFLSEKKEELKGIFKANRNNIFVLGDGGNVKAAQELRSWINTQLKRDDLPDGVSDLLTGSFITTTLGNYVEDNILPPILHRKAFNDTEKAKINKILDEHKGQISAIITDLGNPTHDRLKELEEWVANNAKDINLSDASRQFLSDPHILQTLQKTALSHELAVAFHKDYASGEDFDPTDLIRGIYEQEHPDTQLKLTDDKHLKLTKTETHRFLEIAITLKAERKDIIARHIKDIAVRKGLNPKNEDDYQTLEKEAKDKWKVYIANRSTSGSSTYELAIGKAPVGDYTAPDYIMPKAKSLWFYQTPAKLHFTNWGVPFVRHLPFFKKAINNDTTNKRLENTKFINWNIHIYNKLTFGWGGLLGLKAKEPMHILYLNLPRMFTGKLFGRPLYNDIDKCIKQAGLIEPIKTLQDDLQAIALRIEQNKLSYDKKGSSNKKTARQQIEDTFNAFAEKYKDELDNLEFNTRKRMQELEAIMPESKYSGKEGFVDYTKESAINYAQDINEMAISLARKGEEENTVLGQIVNRLDKVSKKTENDRKAIASTLEAGTINRLERMGYRPEMRLTGRVDDKQLGHYRQARQDEFFALEHTLHTGTYNSATRFDRPIKLTNGELVMGNIGRFHERLERAQREKSTQVGWNVEDVNRLKGHIDYLYDAGFEHFAAMSLKMAIMRMGMKAEDTVSLTLTSLFEKDAEAYKDSGNMHRANFNNIMKIVLADIPDSPRRYGARYSWGKMFPFEEYRSIGWAFAPENSNTSPWYIRMFTGLLTLNPMKMAGVPTGGLPAEQLYLNYRNNLTTKWSAWVSGRTTEIEYKPSKIGELESLVLSDKELVADRRVEETKKSLFSRKEKTVVKYEKGDPLEGSDKFRKQASISLSRYANVAWEALKFAASGGALGSKHIRYACLFAAEAAMVASAIPSVADSISEGSLNNFKDPTEYVNTAKTGWEWGGITTRFALDNTVFAQFPDMDTNTFIANIVETVKSNGDNLSEIWDGKGDGSPDGGVESAPVEAAPATNEYLPYKDTPDQDLFDNSGLSFSSSLYQGGQDLLFDGAEFNSASNGAVNPETGIATETDDDIFREVPDQDLFSFEE